MTDFLREILAHKATELAQAMGRCPLALLTTLAEEQEAPRNFAAALRPQNKGALAVIAECKQRSPSKGLLTPDYDPAALAASYERGGAIAVSVLTDERYFGGCLAHLRVVREACSLPLLRKDFIIDSYQIVEARAYGADSFLLLASVFDVPELQYFIEIGREWGMEPIVLAHNAQELAKALTSDAQLIGINSRNLHTFHTDLDATARLAEAYAPNHQDRLFICESGLTSPQHIARMQQVGYKAFIVGDALIKPPNREEVLRHLLST